MKIQVCFVIFICGVTILEAGEFLREQGTDYYFSYPLRKNWFQAQRFCTYYGLHLISIHSYEEEQAIWSAVKQFKIKHNITKETHFHLYTSGSDLGHLKNEFYWTTTSHPVIYSNWISGHPINQARTDLSSDCLVLNDQYNLRWHDLNCLTEYFFVCQNRVTVPIVNRTNILVDCQID